MLRFSIPVGLAAAAATFVAYEIANAEGETLEAARTNATIVLAAIGLFAIIIVALPLNAWKKWLVASMGALLIALVLFPPTHELFELELPRPAVLLAGAGLVAITGAIMFGTLRAVGWIRHVPELFRDGPPPEASRLWARIKREATDFFERGPQPIDDEAFQRSPDDALDEPVDQDHAYGEVEWFDPEVDPVDYINEPDEGSGDG